MQEEKIRSHSEKILEQYLQEMHITSNDVSYINTVSKPSDGIDLFDVELVKQLFRSINWSFTDNDTTYLSHDIHPYPAKFIPQIPETIIKLLSQPGELVWDPFGGSGTTTLEALLNNRNCISTDINPIGQIIGEAKTTTLSYEDEKKMVDFLNRLDQYRLNTNYLTQYISMHSESIQEQIPPIPNIEKWFSANAIAELAFIKHLINIELQDDILKIVAKASFSKIITKVSNQESETRYSAITKNVAVGETLKDYCLDLSSNLAKIRALGRLLGYRRGKFITADVTADIIGAEKHIQKEQVDLIVTSPPYPNAFDYHLYHRFRIFWLGYDPRDMGNVEVGSHLRYQKRKMGFESFADEMKKVLFNCSLALKPGRYAVFVLGDAIFESKLYKTAELIAETAKELGFEIIDIIDRDLHQTKRSMINGARRAKQEQLLIIRKPAREICVNLIPAQYKLWPYEKVLRSLEKESLFSSSNSEDTFKIPFNNINRLKELTFYRQVCIDNETIMPTWQSIIENGDAMEASNRKDPKYITHGIHPYKGKFYPQLVRPLLNISKVKKGGTVFDPFSGSGTVSLEASLNGYRAFGCDINPIAVEIAKTKNEILFVEPTECEHLLSLFSKKLNNYNHNHDYSMVFNEHAMDEINRWFPSSVINKMGYILREISEVPDEKIQRFLKVILSSIIREISQQEPSDLRIRRRKSEISDASVIELFVEALETQKNRIIKFAKSKHLSPNHLYQSSIWKGNSCDREILLKHIPHSSIDLVITSPPYATALPYIDTNRLSLLVLNGLTANMRVPIESEMTGTREITKTRRIAFEEKIENNDFGAILSEKAITLIKNVHYANTNADVGFRRKNMAALLYIYFKDMSKALLNTSSVLKSDGQVFIVIGDTKTTTGDGLEVIKTTQILGEIGTNVGWHLKNSIPISVTTENYKHINNAITENTILWFKKT